MGKSRFTNEDFGSKAKLPGGKVTLGALGGMRESSR